MEKKRKEQKDIKEFLKGELKMIRDYEKEMTRIDDARDMMKQGIKDLIKNPLVPDDIKKELGLCYTNPPAHMEKLGELFEKIDEILTKETRGK